MQAKIIRIGNSQGIRLPAALIKQYELKEAIEIIPTPDGILIQPSKGIIPRSEWEAILSKMTPPAAENTDWDTTLGDGIE